MFEIKLIFYGLSSMLQFSQFVWPLSYSVWDVFYNFLLIDATDRSKISSDQKRFFIALSLYPLSFFANTPFNKKTIIKKHLKHVAGKEVSLCHKLWFSNHYYLANPMYRTYLTMNYFQSIISSLHRCRDQKIWVCGKTPFFFKWLSLSISIH